jgi:hypothetical protein
MIMVDTIGAFIAWTISCWAFYSAYLVWRKWRTFAADITAKNSSAKHIISHNLKAEIWSLNGTWEPVSLPSVLVVQPSYVALHALDQSLVLPVKSLRWFHATRKFWLGSKLCLDANYHGDWFRINLHLGSTDAQNLFRVLSEVAPDCDAEEGIHYGPVEARPMERLADGSWRSRPSCILYLTPCYLVLFQEKQIQRLISLDEIDRVEPCADQIQIVTHDKTYTFALDHPRALARKLTAKPRS